MNKKLNLVTSLMMLCLMTATMIAQDTPAALNFKMKNIQGEEISLTKYAGKAVLFVNVASKCGLTPQYEALQDLHEKYAGDGLAIVGVPCNQFGRQEPGTEEEVLTFCKTNYGVEFDMMSKVDVKGKTQCALYKHLDALDLQPKGKGPVQWNFEKVLLDRSGTPVARFSPRTKPNDDQLIAAIEKALGKSDDEQGEHFSTKNSKGKTCYLFSKEVKLKNSDDVVTRYFFSGKPTHESGTPVAALPAGKTVSETKTGMLVLKNKE